MEKEIILNNDLKEISRLETFLEELGAELQLGAELLMNINLALEEAVVNIIKYAYPSEQQHHIILRSTFSGQQLIFLLTDKGKSFDPTKVEDANIDLPLEERPVGGLGIFLIRRIMNEVSYERIGDMNRLTLKKNITGIQPGTL